MSPYSAYLRVYEPLVAFREPARAAWALYSDPEADLPDPAQVLGDEELDARQRLAATPPVLVPERESDQALVRKVDDTTYICPLETRMRAVRALGSLADVLPAETLAAAVPDEAAVVAQQRAQEGGQAGECHIKQARWHIPFAWFVLFRQTERRLVLVPDEAAEADGRAEQAEQAAPAGQAASAGQAEQADEGELGRGGADGSDRTMSYLTRMVEARRRLARGLAVLRKTVEGSLVEEVEAVGRWLEEFHPHALVELDYGGLVELVDDGFLLTDRSVVDVAEGLSALSDGDGEAAARHYQAVVTRWAVVERRESAN